MNQIVVIDSNWKWSSEWITATIEREKERERVSYLRTMSAITITINNKIDQKTDTAAVADDSDLLPRTNDVNYNNGKVIGVANGQPNSSILTNSNEMAKKDNEKSNDTYKSQPTTIDGADGGGGAVVVAKNTTANGTTNDVTLSRTLTRNSCGSINGQNIAKSWYARCNRWRSQSCDRRKISTVRYSWNTINNRPA